MQDELFPPEPKNMAQMLASRAIPVKTKHRSERGDLITFFHGNLTNKAGRRFPISFIASKLSLLTLEELYILKSKCNSESKRTYIDKKTGKEMPITFGMVFWLETTPK